jgi:GNAT superfamily N-acetyltransferase
MPGLEPGIHVFGASCEKNVDGRDKPGHDDGANLQISLIEVRGVLIEDDDPAHPERYQMSDNLSVRFVRHDDFDKWLPLWDGYNAFYGRSGPTALARAITDTTWSRFFDGYEPVHGLVAESGGELLGLTHYLYHRSTTLIEPVCYLQDLFTTEAARGKGVGRALIERVYREAKAAGSPRVYWQTHETNAAARLLYDKVAAHLGFIVYRKDV